MTAVVGLGIANILSSLFGNLFGAHQQTKAADRATQATLEAQNRAAELQKQAADDQLAFLRSTDARDYRDWLAREARDRRDWEASEQRRAPFRALADSAVRTLADYIRVPGMQPAQEVPVQRWTAPQYTGQLAEPVNTTMPVRGAWGGPVGWPVQRWTAPQYTGQLAEPVNTRMPVSGGGAGRGMAANDDSRELTEAYWAQHPSDPGNFRDFLAGYTPYMAQQGYQVELIDHPSKLDKVWITNPSGQRYAVDMVGGAGGPSPSFAWMPEQGGSAGAGASSASATEPTWGMLAKYGRRQNTLRNLVRV